MARHRTPSLLWAGGLYVVLALAFLGLFLSRSFVDGIVSPLSIGFARAAGGVFSLAGVPVSTKSSIVYLPNIAVEIVHQCTGIGVALLLLAAVLAFPSPWRAKLGGIAVSLGVMPLVNFVRILSLCWVGMYSVPLLEIGHLYVWPPVVMMVAVATFLLWMRQVVHAEP